MIELKNKNKKGAGEIINETFVKAASENIPVEKQCKILLAYGKILRQSSETKDEALKKLMTGLNICENGTVFESPSSCRIYKSHFLYEIGEFYLDDILAKHNPKKHKNEQSYSPELKAKAEVHLRSSLEIR